MCLVLTVGYCPSLTAENFFVSRELGFLVCPGPTHFCQSVWVRIDSEAHHLWTWVTYSWRLPLYSARKSSEWGGLRIQAHYTNDIIKKCEGKPRLIAGISAQMTFLCFCGSCRFMWLHRITSWVGHNSFFLGEWRKVTAGGKLSSPIANWFLSWKRCSIHFFVLYVF